jgi:hypothetical protein
LIVLLLMTGQAFLRARGPWAKGIVVAFAVWAFLFMAVTGCAGGASFSVGTNSRAVLAADPAGFWP